jgi:hypothetical protein
MALVALGGAFSLIAVTSSTKIMCNSVIFEAGLDTFKGRVFDAVAADTFFFTKAF